MPVPHPGNVYPEVFGFWLATPQVVPPAPETVPNGIPTDRSVRSVPGQSNPISTDRGRPVLPAGIRFPVSSRGIEERLIPRKNKPLRTMEEKSLLTKNDTLSYVAKAGFPGMIK